MPSIGGSLFIRNGVKHDYCFEASILSLLPLCDDIVVLDCQSDDGTTEVLRAISRTHPKIRVIENVQWECAENYDRLAILANQAMGHLQTEWNFVIQGDEVLHEASVPFVKKAVAMAPFQTTSFMMRRINLFGNVDHHIRYDLPTTRKPCSDMVIRLARRGIPSTGDAESLNTGNYCDWSFAIQIILLHYGYVRKPEINLSKAIEMQSWFHGKNSQPDARLITLRDEGTYRTEAFFDWRELAKLDLDHPELMKRWVEERRPLQEACPVCLSGKH